MWKWLRSYPLLLGVLCCVTFVYNGNGWQLNWHGMIMGIVALGVTGFVLMYKLYKSLEKLWMTKGLDLTKAETKYDKIVPVLAFAGLWGAGWQGRMIEGDTPGELTHRWFFAWGDADWSLPFAVALIAVLYLYKILVLTNGLVGKQRD